MKKKTYPCMPSDWHFARAYSFIAIPNGKEANEKHGKGWFWPPLLLFVICAVGSNIHMHWLWFAGILFSFPWFIFKYQSNNNRDYASLVKHYEFATPSNRVIPFVSLDEHALLCHFYRPDQSISHQIKLQDIHSIAMSTMSNSTRQLKLPALINQRAREIGGEIVPEKLKDRQVYQLWLYTNTKVMHRSCITIPTQWFKDETFAAFINHLQQVSGARLELEQSIPSDVPLVHYLQQYSIHTHEKRR